MTHTPEDTNSQKRLPPGLKLLFEMGPLVLFFIAYNRFDILVATGVLMVSVVAALIATYVLTRHMPVMPLVTAAIVVVFGGLTIVFQDPTFIKMKATIVYLLFGAALLGGLAFGKSLLSVVLDTVVQMKEEGWRQLTWRWAFFFFFMAGLNEIVWRTQSETFWVKFKVFGFAPITLLFALAQTPLILRYELKGEEAEKAPDHL